MNAIITSNITVIIIIIKERSSLLNISLHEKGIWYLENERLLKNGKSMRLTLAGETATGNSFTYLEIPKSDACLNHEIRKPVINSSTYLIVEWLLRDVRVKRKIMGGICRFHSRFDVRFR